MEPLAFTPRCILRFCIVPDKPSDEITAIFKCHSSRFSEECELVKEEVTPGATHEARPPKQPITFLNTGIASKNSKISNLVCINLTSIEIF